MNQRPLRRPWLTRALLLAGAFACLAPTPGDIGGCGARVGELDPVKFFEAKRDLDCERCKGCSIQSRSCDAACEEPLADAGAPAFLDQCYPLVHDGQVCLRALRASGCDEYRRYMDDLFAEVPTECNFCPVEAADD